mgnify:CR=1 FL=1
MRGPCESDFPRNSRLRPCARRLNAATRLLTLRLAWESAPGAYIGGARSTAHVCGAGYPSQMGTTLGADPRSAPTPSRIVFH